MAKFMKNIQNPSLNIRKGKEIKIIYKDDFIFFLQDCLEEV